MSDHQEYPKWVGTVIAKNKAEEEALLSGRAILKETHSALGDTVEVVGIAEAVKAKAKET